MQYAGFCIAIAVGVGISMWIAMDNATLGLTIGAGVGIALWSGFGAKSKEKDGSKDQEE